MKYEKIVTLYDTARHADAARRNLESAGFAPREISTINNHSLALPGEKLREPMLWRTLFGRDVEPYECELYGRAVESGGVVLIARVPATDVEEAMAILNAHESVDLRRRAAEQGLAPVIPIVPPEIAAEPPRGAKPATMSVGAGEDQVLRLAEEKLNVGKRVVQEGVTRIRRYVSERPVEAQVTLHEEHVQVIRRVTADLASARDIDWTEKTIEVEETIEEPVVTKSVHIAEEIVIHKETTERVQTLRDKVRRHQVEVEHVPLAEVSTKKRA